MSTQAKCDKKYIRTWLAQVSSSSSYKTILTHASHSSSNTSSTSSISQSTRRQFIGVVIPITIFRNILISSIISLLSIIIPLLTTWRIKLWHKFHKNKPRKIFCRYFFRQIYSFWRPKMSNPTCSNNLSMISTSRVCFFKIFLKIVKCYFPL